jgi:hypothetical protein
VPKNNFVKVAFATEDGFLINTGFEQTSQIVVYEVSTTSAQECDTLRFQNTPVDATDLSAIRRGGGKCGGGCGDKEEKDDSITKDELATRIARLAGVSVLFVHKPLKALSGLALNDARIFTVKVDNQREIADVLVRLEDMLRDDTPLWLRRALTGKNAATE